MKKVLKVFKWIGICLVSIVVLALVVRFVGQKINSTTPKNGINEQMYIDVNGQQQWISIYGEDKNNPAMLYLHGGPGYSTSYADWVEMRKLAKDYTVICWDQRNSGKTLLKDPKDEPITPEMMRSDIEFVVDSMLERLGKEKITLLGMSWGTFYGCDYALNHPDKVECIINLSQCVDEREGLLAVKWELLKRTEGNEADHELAQKYEPTLLYDLDKDLMDAFNSLSTAEPEERAAILENNPELKEVMEKLRSQTEIVMTVVSKYMPDDESVFDADYNVIAAVYFCPYYSLSELYKISKSEDVSGFTIDDQQEFYSQFSLLNRTKYEMPFYVLQGKNDDNDGLVKNYMEKVTAPDKDMQYIEGGHMSTMLQSEQMAKFVHDIAEKSK